ncbi:ComEC/Rec2 family competence protein [Micromonospora purpureochromogenes]|uniref:ComEC/Rec2 family competence protein n=1 Tax=Micromonospora purpureochromogenes TaxID=47872 RepID=UPI0036372E76
MVRVDPDLAGDAGFALTVLATGGLLLLAPRWRDALRRRGIPAGLAEALAVPAAAQLACGPVVAGISGTVSLVAVPANCWRCRPSHPPRCSGCWPPPSPRSGRPGWLMTVARESARGCRPVDGYGRCWASTGGLLICGGST